MNHPVAKLKAHAKPVKNTVRGLSVPKLKETAVHIVNKEVSRQLSAAGKQACLNIGVGLLKVLEDYQVYYDEVGQMDIDLATIAQYFTPEVWASFNNNQKQVLEAAIRGRAQGFQENLDRHIKYLRDNKAGVETLGPSGQAAVEARLRELQGLGEEPC